MTAAPRKTDALFGQPQAEDADAGATSPHGWPHERYEDGPGAEAWRLLFQFIQRLKETFPAMAAEFDLSAVQMRVLLELDPELPMPMSGLALKLSCDASNVTGLVDRLEARGLIERRSDVHDRRVKILAVTPAGAALRDKMFRRIAKPPPPIATLPATEQRALVRLMKRALEASSD